MPIDIISVKMDVGNPVIHEQITAILASLNEFYVRKSSTMGVADLIVVEVNEDLKLGAAAKDDLTRLNDLYPPDVAAEVILTSPRSDPAVLLQTLRLGVKEFLPQPIDEAETKAAFVRSKQRRQESLAQNRKVGEVIDILAAKGGAGATTISVNLAACLKAAGGVERVALVDMNPVFGEVPLFLDLRPSHHWGEIVKNIDRLDPMYLSDMLVAHASGLQILPSPPKMEEIGTVSPMAMASIVEMLKGMFEYVVIDSGQSITLEVTRRVLEVSDRVFLVTVMNLPSLTVAKRNLETFDRLDYPMDKVKMVVNRYLKTPEISLEDVHEILEIKPYWLIPNDYQSCMSSLNQGKSLMALDPATPISKAFKGLASAVVGSSARSGKANRGSFWKWLGGKST